MEVWLNVGNQTQKRAHLPSSPQLMREVLEDWSCRLPEGEGVLLGFSSEGQLPCLLASAEVLREAPHIDPGSRGPYASVGVFFSFLPPSPSMRVLCPLPFPLVLLWEGATSF